MKTKITFILTFLVFTLSSFSQDGYLSNLNIARYLKLNTNYTITANLNNNENIGIKSVTFAYQLDSGQVHSQFTTIGGGGVTSNNYVPLSFSPDINISQTGVHTLKVWIRVPNDTNSSNDTITKEINVLSNYVDRNVLAELYTATWCSYCPAASAVLKTYENNPNVIVASFHNSDDLSFTDGETYMEAYYPGNVFTPGGIFNMGEFGTYEINSVHQSWSDDIDGRLGISPVNVVTSATMDSVNRKLVFTINANFKTAIDGDYYMKAYIVEQNIYKYQNSGGSSYCHKNTIRDIVGVNGISGIIPTTIAANVNYSLTDSVSIPTSWNIKNIEVIGILFEKKNGLTEVINTNNIALYNTVSIQTPDISEMNIEVLPNPAKDFISITNINNENEIQIFDLGGKLMIHQKIDASTKLHIGNLEKGVYILNIITQSGAVQTHKFVKM